ncbi:DNA mismatch repair protein MutL [Parathielavia hyrcaniae]|uniref:DNA mismatch repair protein PMS1 n=1 Tax=Parathielavia hyrcaniae TaxID=113614 RepID=A0AAN6PXI9_9PEZI|nr:DNA mismatch repair protein MutL [Parathielavia hyrcaniae]
MASSATIKAIESSTVHQIQSGQVIVDLCSVAKELVENSVDAGATAIEVRFKNQGLNCIEVQDNGSGIAPHNYESIALKHYTSKLSSYDDLSELQTFGFRGEALSSLCALSRFSVVTCTQQEAPRASRLEFETSGKLKSASVVSGQRGTAVIVENLFHNLPVRRRELERNIKREWGKVINLLNQYACVQTGVKFTVSQQPTKGKRMILFSTKGNATTRENIINVFGVKTMSALITMDLKLDLIPTAAPLSKGKAPADGSTTEISVVGHVSRPAHGEGRQTPDRQMFYVNGRPCGLPQFAKVFNEVYRSYNASQSPFIFADIQLDTHLYDVNVSPDKRTILLHDQGQMLDNLRESLVELFETQDVTVPVSQAANLRQTPFKTPAAGRMGTLTSAQPSSRAATADSARQPEAGSPIRHEGLAEAEDDLSDAESDNENGSEALEENAPQNKTQKSFKSIDSSKGVTLMSRWLAKSPESHKHSVTSTKAQQQEESATQKTAPSSSAAEAEGQEGAKAEEQASPEEDEVTERNNQARSSDHSLAGFEKPRNEAATGSDEAEVEARSGEPEPPVPAIAPPSQPPTSRALALGTARPLKRSTEEVATITIGDHTVTSLIGNPSKRARVEEPSKPVRATATGKGGKRVPLPSFGGRLSQLFSNSARPGEGSLDEIGVVPEDAEEEREDYGEDVDEIVEEEDEDGSLFVSQGESGRLEAEEEEPNEEAGDEPPEPAQPDVDSPYDADSPLQSVDHFPSCDHDHPTEDDEYVDEEEKKAREDKKVQKLLEAAEAAAEPTEEGEKRSHLFVKGRSKRKNMTLHLVQPVKTSSDDIRQRIAALARHVRQPQPNKPPPSASQDDDGLEADDDAEAKLSLKISKTDFAKMRIVGQFNLGFILAVRQAAPPSTSTADAASDDDDDELFIIDQHASDEKYNFERFQATTTVQSQRLVQPKTLDLTALEEEIILEHLPALERNGFLVQVDTSGARPVGARVRLLSLPLSRETTFSLADLDELVFLLADNPTSAASTVPRPSRVRSMFAMRACRSSVMIGRALSARQMERVVRHMGDMEKPWNCPHGRPTMRHLCGLGAWDGRGWMEEHGGGRTDWGAWARERGGE